MSIIKKSNKEQNNGNVLFNWIKRIFYTMFLVVAVYVMILATTVMIPAFISFIISGLGFTLKTYREQITALLAGGFFTAWLFVFTYAIGKRMWRLYAKGIKGTMSPETLAKWKELYSDDDKAC
jgi:hypothetical protein